MLLIVSNKSDLATDYLILKLHEKNIRFLRINTEDFLTHWEVNFLFDSDNANTLAIKKTGAPEVFLEEISGAYIRQPKLPTLDVIEADKPFAEREVGETLRSLWRLIDEKLWLNAPHNILRASNKPEQLKIAKSLGFSIPQTCITADSKVAKKFYMANHGDIIVKAVKHGFLYDGTNAKIAPTQKFEAHALDDLTCYARIPMTFQKRVEKIYDIRVTVVGENVFATAIYSQSHQETATDWRVSDHYKISLEQKPILLPEKLQKLCKQLTQKLNLRYSAIDLILAKNEQYYFLEVNPNGQWAWIEKMAKYPIRDAIINELYPQGL